MVLLIVLAGLTVLAKPAEAATAVVAFDGECDRFDPAQADEVTELRTFEPSELGTDIGPVPGAKERSVESGASVALIIDRSRVYTVDRGQTVGASGTFGPWWCGNRGHLRCSATLIDPEWVLTAAHCVSAAAVPPTTMLDRPYQDIEVFSLLARTGSVDARDGGNLTAVAETWVHPDWTMRVEADGSWTADYWNMRNDVALLHLAEPVDIEPAGFFSPPDLHELQRAPLVATGWGFTPTGLFEHLHTWTTSVIDPATCAERDNTDSFDPDTMLCTDESDGSGTCLGDSGGPLGFLDDDGSFHVVAITGFVMFRVGGQTCDQPRLASFTTLTPDHHDWISSVFDTSQAE